jgi:hypothetical protein
MTFAEAIAKISAMEGGEELANAVTAEMSKKNKENQTLRGEKKTAESELKAAKATLKDAFTAIGVSEEQAAAEDFDLDDALEAYLDKALEGKGKGKDSPEFIEMQKTLKALQKSVDKLTAENTEFKTAAETERGKRHGALKENALIKSLEENKAVKSGFLAKSLLDKVRIDDADGKDSLVFVGDDGEETTIAEGIKAFLAANPEFVANGQHGGAGTSGGSPGGKNDQERGKTIAEERNKAQTSSQQPGLNPWGAPAAAPQA